MALTDKAAIIIVRGSSHVLKIFCLIQRFNITKPWRIFITAQITCLTLIVYYWRTATIPSEDTSVSFNYQTLDQLLMFFNKLLGPADLFTVKGALI